MNLDINIYIKMKMIFFLNCQKSQRFNNKSSLLLLLLRYVFFRIAINKVLKNDCQML